MNSCKKYLLDLLDKYERKDLTKEDIESWAAKIIEEDHFPHYLENKTYLIMQQEITIVLRLNYHFVILYFEDYIVVDKLLYIFI
jgi:hypothetical protein